MWIATSSQTRFGGLSCFPSRKPDSLTSPYMTKREKAQFRANLYSLAHDIAGGILLAGLIVALAFLFSVK
jgi:hypothetical protein